MTTTDEQRAGSARGQEAPDRRTRLRNSRLGTLLVLVVTTLLVLGGAYLLNRPGGESAGHNAASGASPGAGEGVTAVDVTGGARGPAPAVGGPAPDFSATTVEGRRVALAQLRGRPVWVTFGATWCASCRSEFADIEAAHSRRAGTGLAVLGIYLSEDAAAVGRYASGLGLSYPQIPDPQTAIASTYRVMGVPTHYFVDREGVVRSIRVGVLDPAAIDAELAKIGA